MQGNEESRVKSSFPLVTVLRKREKTKRLSINPKEDLLLLHPASPKVQRALLKRESCQQPSWDEKEEVAFHPAPREEIQCLLPSPLTFDSCSDLPSHPVNPRGFHVKGDVTDWKTADYSICPKTRTFMRKRTRERFSTFPGAVLLICTLREGVKQDPPPQGLPWAALAHRVTRPLFSCARQEKWQLPWRISPSQLQCPPQSLPFASEPWA